MSEQKSKALKGSNNKRLNNMDVRNNEITLPLVDVKQVLRNSNLTIPSEEDVFHAKEWVDDGSRL